jgi:hypothetical protein
MLALTVQSSSFAQEVVELKAGDKAPFTGLLFTPTKAESIRQELITKDELEKTNESLKKTIELQDLNLKLRSEQVTALLEQNDVLIRHKTTSDLEKLGYAALGILGTSLAIFAAARIVK